MEGFNYAHGIADFFGIEKEKVGDIYGIVRDQHERFRDDTYVPVATHDDVYKPLDGVPTSALVLSNAYSLRAPKPVPSRRSG